MGHLEQDRRDYDLRDAYLEKGPPQQYMDINLSINVKDNIMS